MPEKIGSTFGFLSSSLGATTKIISRRRVPFLSIIFLTTGLYLASTCSFKKLFFRATISVGFSVSFLKSRTYEPENQVLNVEWETWDLTPERILFQIFLPSIGLTILSNIIFGS